MRNLIGLTKNGKELRKGFQGNLMSAPIDLTNLLGRTIIAIISNFRYSNNGNFILF